MSNQNDLDDQLYILLASMKEYREAIADDNKRLEVFYNQVASGVLDKAEKSLENANKKHTSALNNSIQSLNEATNKLNLKFIIIFASTFVAVMMVFILEYSYTCQARMKFKNVELIWLYLKNIRYKLEKVMVKRWSEL